MQISASLRISGKELDPVEITSVLRVAPYLTRRRGDVRVSSSGKEILSRVGLWTWKSENASGTLTMNEIITQLQVAFSHHYPALRDLPQAEQAWVDICIVKGDAGNADGAAEFMLDTNSTTILHAIGLPVEFTVY